MPKQTTDISGDPYGIQYTAIGQKWTVANGVDVLGTTAGVYSTFASSRFVNLGDVSGGAGGVVYSPLGATGTYTIENRASGAIDGQYGVYVVNFLGSLDITNAGEILGNQIGIFTLGSSDVAFENTGNVSGTTIGVYFAGSVAGAAAPVVDNFGSITGGQYGVLAGAGPGLVTKVFNHEGGLIKGGLFAVVALGEMSLKNEGKIVGAFFGGGQSEKVVNLKVIKGDVQLGLGDDSFKNKGAARSGLIDTGDGNDRVVLGDKADKLLFDYALNAATNVDTVRKFVSGKDAIYLDEDIFTAIMPGTLSSAAFHEGTSAADADDRIIYDKASGALYYDPDGLGGLAQTQFAKLDGGPTLKAADFTIGEYSLPIL